MRKREMLEQLRLTEQHAQEIADGLGCSGLDNVDASTVQELACTVIALAKLVHVMVEEQWHGPYQ